MCVVCVCADKSNEQGKRHICHMKTATTFSYICLWLYHRHLEPDHVYKITPICIIPSIAVPPTNKFVLQILSHKLSSNTKKMAQIIKMREKWQTLYMKEKSNIICERLSQWLGMTKLILRYESAFRIETKISVYCYHGQANRPQVLWESTRMCLYLLALVHEYSILI